ncbi:MAG: hypothetical protein JJU34_18050 [Lunatimonas sp.]|uniref:hypothetical protein n=1 Tax=Lunatimonas sp. TaxID=2060141 RepID=UPI00263B5D17|nr:hypothetical protein [Lunatimonas sp.]MCC5939188.1 hypothetical protein [Lunatimonas sp.]
MSDKACYWSVKSGFLFGWLILLSSCSNILEFESIGSCGVFDNQAPLRSWNSVDGMVRYDQTRMEFFVVARFPGDSNLSVLRVCNFPAAYMVDEFPIRFFGSEFDSITEDRIEEDGRSATIRPFEITYIERVRK